MLRHLHRDHSSFQAYVESVNSNGSVRVSEMNYGHGAGVVTSRTISANQAGSYPCVVCMIAPALGVLFTV
jgi:hypothetical protein